MPDISAFVGRDVEGNLAVTYGTYTDTGAGGGTINTRLHTVLKMILQPTGSSTSADASVINATFPIVGGAAVTIVCDVDEVGTWIAYGDAFA